MSTLFLEKNVVNPEYQKLYIDRRPDGQRERHPSSQRPLAWMSRLLPFHRILSRGQSRTMKTLLLVLVFQLVFLLSLVRTLNAWSMNVKSNPRRQQGVTKSPLLLQPALRRRTLFRLSAAASSDDDDDEVDLEFLKRELTEYMAKRKEVGADEKAQK